MSLKPFCKDQPCRGLQERKAGAHTTSGIRKLLPGQPRAADEIVEAILDGARLARLGLEAIPRACELAIVLGASAHVTDACGAAGAEALGLDLAVDARLGPSDAADDNVRHFVREGTPLSADQLLIALALAAAVGDIVLGEGHILAEVAIVHTSVQEAQTQAAIEGALGRRSGRGAALTNVEHRVRVPALQASDEALGSASQ